MKTPFAAALLAGFLVILPTASAQADIPCREFLPQTSSEAHFLPTGDGSISRYNAIASRDGFAYTIVKGSTSSWPSLFRCLELGATLYQPPIIRSVVSLPTASTSIVLMAGYAYLPLGSLGLGVIDVSNPDYLLEPVLTGTPDVCRDAAPWGTDYLVTSQWSALRIYDLQSPTAPEEISAVTLTQARTVAVANDLAFVACGSLGLSIVDIADVAVPQVIGTFPLGGFVDQIAVAGNRVYLTGYLVGLVTVDVTDPTSPLVVDTLPLEGEPEAIAIRGGFAYITVGEAIPVVPGMPDFDAMALVRLNPWEFPTLENYLFTTENYSSLALGDDLVLLGETEVTSDLVLAPLMCPAPSAISDPGLATVSISPPWPNPFNPRVTVRFNLPEGRSGRLTVHDLRGRMMAEVWRGNGGKPDLQATWNGNDRQGRSCPSGAYFFRLIDSTGRPAASVRAVLLR